MADKKTYLKGINNKEAAAWECFYADYYAAPESAVPDEYFTATVREELVRLLRIHINDLPVEARKIFELSLDRLSGGEIAETLGISIHTVKSQKNRCLKILREKMKGAFFLVFV